MRGLSHTSGSTALELCIGKMSLYNFWLLRSVKLIFTGSCDGAQVRPRGATPCPRSGAEAGRTPCPRGGGQEELPHVRGQGQWPRVPGYDGAGTAERSYPASEVRGSGREELPPV